MLLCLDLDLKIDNTIIFINKCLDEDDFQPHLFKENLIAELN